MLQLRMNSHESEFEPGLTWEQKKIAFQERAEGVYKNVMVPTILEGDETRPIAVALGDERVSMLYCDDDDFNKHAFFAFVGEFCKKYNSKNLYFITEVWYLKKDKEDFNPDIAPSQSPDRIEGLMQLYIDLETKKVESYMEDIIRSNGEIALVKADMKMEEAESLSGSMFDAIFKPQGHIVLAKTERKDDNEIIN